MARTVTVSFLLGLFLLGGAAAAEGQRSLDFDLGSSRLLGFSANPPQQLMGAGAVVISPALRGWGLYVDGKFTYDSPRSREFISGRTPADADADGHVPGRDESAWTTLNVGVVRPLSSELALYVTGGVAWRTVYSHYFDDVDQELGREGFYWVEDDDLSETLATVSAGALFRMGRRLAVQFGGQTAPAGVNVGIFFLLF
jgi:hypothetical protein